MLSPSQLKGPALSSEKARESENAEGSQPASAPNDGASSLFSTVSSSNIEDGPTPEAKRGPVERLKIALGFRNSNYAIFNENMPTTVPSLTEYTESYALVAALLDVEPSFLMTRRFGWLHVRVLLWLQDQLSELELEYKEVEKNRKEESISKVSRRYDEKTSERRRSLLENINTKLQEYDEALLRVKSLYSLPSPSKRDMASTYKFMLSTGSIQTTEREWIEYSEDLVHLGPEYADDWFRHTIEKGLKLISRRGTLRFFRSKVQRDQTGVYTDVHLVSKPRIEAIVYIVLSAACTFLLLLPVGILSAMQEGRSSSNIIHEILVISGFTLFFTLMCSAVTRAPREQIFLASATYIAVLVVFLGTSLQNQNSSTKN